MTRAHGVKSWLAWGCVLALGLSLGLAQAAETYRVSPKPDTVQKNDKIDPGKGEPETVAPESVGDGTIVTKTFVPPAGMTFTLFPQFNTHVDIELDPSTINPTRDKDADDEIKVTAAGVPANAGMFPLKCEGNLTPPAGPAGTQPHWSAKVADIRIELTNVEGVDEAGTLRVHGVITPTQTVASSTVLVNGQVRATGGGFTAGDFVFHVDQNTLFGNSLVEILLRIKGRDYRVGFRATRTTTAAEGSDNYYESYVVENFGMIPYTFAMYLTERYATMTYSIAQSGRTNLADQSELLLSNLPQGELGDPFLQRADHWYVTDTGNLYPLLFGSDLTWPVMIGEHDVYQECHTRKWITPEAMATIKYGVADNVVVGLRDSGLVNLPCGWVCAMTDDDVEAPDQVGQ